MTPPPIHTLFSLGISPAVITEALWALTVQHGHTVQTVEIWTTEAGRAILLSQHAGFRGAIDALRAEVGDRVPPAPSFAELDAEAPLDDAPWQVRVLRDDNGRELDDARTREQLDQILATLNDRLRALCRASERPLHAVLAGGRKTMSSSLQQAFSMQAGPADRLWHVLLHPQLDRRYDKADPARGGVHGDSDYWLPTALHEKRYGIGRTKQVVLIEVPVPRLHLFLDAPAFTGGFARDDGGWTRDWGAWLDPTITLGLRTLVVAGRGEAREIPLSAHRSLILVALTLRPDGLSVAEINALLALSTVSYEGASGDESRVSTLIKEIRTALAERLPPALAFLQIATIKKRYRLYGAGRVALADELNNGGHLAAVRANLRAATV